MTAAARIASIPTEYKGVRFRSRLEARWAAFFDLAGWRWEYEPIDKIGWTPDFVLIGKDDVVKAEVKPIEWHGTEAEIFRVVQTRDDLGKVRSYARLVSNRATSFSGDEVPSDNPDILVLGAYPHFSNFGFSDVCLGVFLSERWGASTIDLACLAGGYPPRELDFHAWYGSYGYRMGGEQDGDHHIRSLKPELVQHLWARAGNITRWNAA